MLRRWLMPSAAAAAAAVTALCLASGPVLAAAGAMPTQAHPSVPSAQPVRPKIGLVLSGGGARGLAHIGVLQVLEELRVPVDIVVGASFGAIVGGAYASGADVAELEKLVLATDWAVVLQDRPPRDELSFRRRQDDTLVSSRLYFGVTRDGLALPSSAFTSTEVEQLLRQMAPTSAFVKVEELPLTYRGVATDMLTGEMVVPTGVPLFAAMRASMSVPGVFTPVTLDGRILGDGGLVSNLPVRLARDLGADIVIAVNLGTPLGGPDSITTALGMAQQMINILTEQNVQQSLRELRPQDVLIVPDLAGQDALDFAQARRSIAAGVAAARAQAQRLQTLAVEPSAYAAHREHRVAATLAATQSVPVVGSIRVEATDAQVLRVPIARPGALKPGEPLTPAALSAAAARLKRDVEAERVDALVTGTGPIRDVVLLPVSSPFGLSRSRLGLELESDFDGTNQFTMSGLYTRGGMNAWGAEWRTLARVGAVGQLQTEWHQPLGLASPWFVDGVLDYKGYEVTLYENLEPVAGVGLRTASASIALGRQVGDIGSFRLGARYRWGRGKVVLPGFEPVSLNLFLEADRSAFYELTLDTLDSLGYPSSGYLLSASGEYALRSGETTNRLYSSRYEGLYAASSGDWSGHLYAAGIRSSADGYIQPLALGGFLRLSGAPLNSIFSDQAVLARTVFARRVGRLPALAGGAVRIGFSLEAGWAKGAASVSDRSTFYGGSVFVQTETRMGPIYLALGSTRGAGTAVYLFLGPVLLPSGLLR